MKYSPKLKIESGIPIPPRQAQGFWAKTLLDMKEGDSFVVETRRERDSVLNCSKRTAGVPVTTRKLNGAGYRIWRIKK